MSSLGYADIVAALVGPLVQGGASVYATHEEAKLGKKELKQREQEFAEIAKLQEAQLKAQERLTALSTQASLRKSLMQQTFLQQNLPWVVGGIAILGLAVVTAAALRGGK